MNQLKTNGFDLALTVLRERAVQGFHGVTTFGGVGLLPTVWTNCLAAWWLGAGGDAAGLIAAMCGVSLLFIGGSFFSFAYYSETRAGYSRGSGLGMAYLEPRHLWLLSLGYFALGLVILAFIGRTSTVVAFFLGMFLVVYVTSSGVFMAAPLSLFMLRFAVYLLAGSVSRRGITGDCVWQGLAVGCYMSGIGFLTVRTPSAGSQIGWPHLLLAVPGLLALLVNEFTLRNLFLCFLFFMWLGWALRYCFGSHPPNVRYTLSNLLAGVVLVDLLATYGESFWLVLAFMLLFPFSILLVRSYPLAKIL
jgi:hypothetical protein